MLSLNEFVNTAIFTSKVSSRSSCSRSHKSATSIDDQQEPINRVRPQRIGARHLKKITLHYNIYEFEWHTIEEIDYERVYRI